VVNSLGKLHLQFETIFIKIQLMIASNKTWPALLTVSTIAPQSFSALTLLVGSSDL